MTKVSPIAEYLRINKAIPKHDKYGCHFVSPEGLYLGRMTTAIVNNYKVFSLDIFGEGLKKMYSKSMAIGQQYGYIKNNSAPLGVSLMPIKTLMRKIFVDFINKTSHLEDSEKTLTNKLDLIAIDKSTSVGLYNTNKPFKYKKSTTHEEDNFLKQPKFKFNLN